MKRASDWDFDDAPFKPAHQPAGYRKEGVTLYFDQEQIDRLRAVAKARRIPYSAIVRRAVVRALELLERANPELGLAPLEDEP